MAKGGGDQPAPQPAPAPRYFYNFLEGGKWRQGELPGSGVSRYATDEEAKSKFSDEISSLALSSGQGRGPAIVPVGGRDYSSFAEGEVYNVGGEDYLYKDGGFRRGKRFEVRGAERPVFQFVTEQESEGFKPGSLFKQNIDGKDAYFAFKNDAFEPFTFGQGEFGAQEVGQGVTALPGKRTTGRFSDTIVSNLSLGGGRVLGPPVASGVVDTAVGERPQGPTVGQPLAPLRSFSMFNQFRNRPAPPPSTLPSWGDSIVSPGSDVFLSDTSWLANQPRSPEGWM